ncbi:MAG TPA: pyruvate kinase [Saprospiraceae bacterium]|nr:pyruvate kinase [Saprospiraceae bacterium]
MKLNSKYINQILAELTDIENHMKANFASLPDAITEIHHSHKLSAQNLIHYLSLRDIDIRKLQDELHVMGLSSLASSESHILRQVQEVKMRLGASYRSTALSPITEERATENLKRKIHHLFGVNPEANLPFIMVTFDKSFGDDYAVIKSLLLNGMNVARINCAHDNEEMWARMIHHIRKASNKTGKQCKIYMDLAGPKIRTKILTKKKHLKGSLEPGQVIWLAENKDDITTDEIVISPGIEGIIEQLKKGERVLIDDGVIQGEIEWADHHRAAVRITRVSKPKLKLKDDKGINFPDSDINISALTEFDKQCLPFMSEHADMVGYSFVKTPDDLTALRNEFNAFNIRMPHFIIKIETTQAVKQLPAILLEGMKDETFGVMIARGDLAVEIGFERTGEIQEEILWLCEAAHVPVIWATQVLESLNKSGLATRSEITDAGHAAAADCIMLNKGPHTIEVLETLKEIIKRSSEHKNKKRYLFRPLSIARDFISSLTTENQT